MASRRGLWLAVVLVAAVAAIAWLLLAEETGGPGAALAPGTGAGTGAGPLEIPGAELAPAPGAREARERVEAERVAAERARVALLRREGVHGRVTDGRGRPIAEAMVKLMTSPRGRWTWGIPDPPALATATADDDGFFVVGPAPAGMLRVRAEAPGYAPSVKPVRRRGYRVDLVLDRGGSLEVTVKSGEGEGLAEARVLYQAGDVMSEATSAEGGRAWFPGLPTGSGTLYVSREGYAGVQQDDVGVAPGRTERLTIVLGPPIVVDASVVDTETEQPVPDARVTVHYARMPWLAKAGPFTADGGGRLEFETPAPVGQTLEVETDAPGYAVASSWHQVTDSGNGRMSLEIKLAAGSHTVRGEVVDMGGRPVRGARVSFVGNRQGRAIPETRTDADGWFALAAPPWMARPGTASQVVALSEPLGVGVAYARVPREGEESNPLRIRLSGVGSVHGQVTDEAGEGVAGALVALSVDWSTQMRQAPGGAPGGIPPWVLAQILDSGEVGALDGVTGEEGRFTLDGVPAATYVLSATFGLDTVTAPEAFAVTPGATVRQDLALGEGARIEGFVRDTEGRPVAGAYVTGQPEGRPGGFGPGMALSARSQSDGAFALHGASAPTYRLRARAAGYQSERVRGITPGDRDVSLVLKPLGWVEGVVTYEGRPHEGTFVVTTRRAAEERGPQGQMAGPMRGGGGRTVTFNTDDGRFVVRNLRAGPYDVTAQTPDGLIAADAQRADVVDGQGSRVRLALVGGAEVSGVLLDDASGGPIPGASITVQAAPGPDAPMSAARARTDAEGRFLARGLAAGSYVVHVWPPSGVAFQRGIELSAGEHKELTLRERRTGSVRVVVRDTEGRPVEGAQPTLTSEAGTPVWPSWTALRRDGLQLGRDGWRAVLQTDAAGVNLRRHVPPGRYEVSATLRGYVTVEPKSIQVASDRVTDVEVVLRLQDADPARPPPPPAGRR